MDIEYVLVEKMRFMVGYYIDGAYRNVNINSTIESNKIYNIAMTYDGLKVKMYINGEKYATENSITGTIKKPGKTTTTALGVNATDHHASSSFFNGKIYSAAVYDRALTEEEILQNYQVENELFGIEN